MDCPVKRVIRFTNDSNILKENQSLEPFKASKIQLSLNGYYSEVKNDIRKLYYAINDIQIKAL